MRESSKDFIKNALSKLSKEELTELKARIEFLLQTDAEKLQFEDLLFSAICGKLNSCGATVPSFYLFKKTTSYKKFKEVYQYLEQFINNNFAGIQRPARVKFYFLFSSAVIMYLKNHNLPVNLKTVLNSYQYFEASLDSMFPNYLESGLFKTIILSAKQEE